MASRLISTADIGITREVKSQYRGVVRGEAGWYAYCRTGSVGHYEGPHSTEEGAARAYDDFWRRRGRTAGSELNLPTPEERARSDRYRENNRTADGTPKAKRVIGGLQPGLLRAAVIAYCNEVAAAGGYPSKDMLGARFPGAALASLTTYRAEAFRGTPLANPQAGGGLPCTCEEEAELIRRRAKEMRPYLMARSGCLVEQRGADGRLRLVRMEVRS